MKLRLGPADLLVDFEFTIPENITEVGLYLSGGLDSAALLCLILTELRNTNRLNTINVKCFTITKNDGSMIYAAAVVKEIASMFNTPIEHINNYNNDDESILKGRVGLRSIQEIWKSKGDNTEFYMAVNRMAPAHIRPFAQKLNIIYINSPYYSAPFINLHKPQILDIFYKLNCEQIIPITHTCTVDAQGRCNQCYSCAERSWAFSSLNKKDLTIAIC